MRPDTRDIIFQFPGNDTGPTAVLAEWFVNAGDAVEAGQHILNYEVDKAVASFHSPAKGLVERLLLQPGDRLGPGQAVARFGDPVSGDVADASSEGDAPRPDSIGAYEEFDWTEIDFRPVPPTPLDRMRATIARRMVMSKRHIPCFYLTAVVDMSACVRLRAELKKDGKKATYNDMVMRASALALVKNPRAASVFAPEGRIDRASMNIGFAALLPDDGLAVPVVHNVEQKTLIEVAAETRALTAKARAGRLEPADCAKGVFSVSYLGSYEVDEFIAIVNPGEAAILAVGQVREQPAAVDGRVEIRPLMKITLSCDHRTIDGALAARLAGDIKAFLEHPDRL